MARWGARIWQAIALAPPAAVVGLLLHNPYETPEEALAAFYEASVPECVATWPLRQAGRLVVPLVITEVANPQLRKRIYAISFLGEGRYREAIPALAAMSRDEAEPIDVRSYALLAIAEIDLRAARRIAAEPSDAAARFGRVAQAVLEGGSALRAMLDRSCG